MSTLSDIEAAEQRSQARRRLGYTVLAATTGVVVLVLLVVSGGQNLRSVTGSGSRINLATTVTIKSLEASSTRVYYDALEHSEKEALFTDFKSQYSKSYSTDDEESERFHNFKKFLKLIDARNDAEEGKDNTAVHGVTQFADLSEHEVKKYLLGYKKPSDKSRRKLKLKSSKAKVEKYKGSNSAVDWAGIYTTSVSDQGYCGR